MVRRKALVVIGHFCSGASIAAAAVYARAGLVQITPASRHPKLTDERAGPNVFRLAGRDDGQGSVAGKFLADRFMGKKVAILHDRTRYGRSLADDTRAHMNRAGLQEAIYEAYSPGAKDYGPLVAKLKAADVEVVYIGGYAAEAGLIARQMREQDLAARLMSGDALATADYWDAAGPAGEGTLMTFPPDAGKNPAAAAAVAHFRAKGIEPDGTVVHTYAAVRVWLDAVTAAGTDDPADVMNQLATREFATALGAVRFNSRGDALLAPYDIYEWRRGRYEPLDATQRATHFARPTPTR